MTYGESPHSHIRTEFAFDVKGTQRPGFRARGLLERVGFRVPRKFLHDVFIATYGIDIAEVLERARPDLKSYRTSVRSFIPAFAEAEACSTRSSFCRRQIPRHTAFLRNESYKL